MSRPIPTKEIIEVTSVFLEVNYPHLFGEEVAPLAIGIYEELCTRHPELVDAFEYYLSKHTRSSKYHRAVWNDGEPRMRVSLDQEETTEITPAEMRLSGIVLAGRGVKSDKLKALMQEVNQKKRQKADNRKREMELQKQQKQQFMLLGSEIKRLAKKGLDAAEIKKKTGTTLSERAIAKFVASQ
ncbi:ProQ/FINO family protein [Sinobacterium caligoides]|uniref:ProQ/FINO family protein n=1 Tax=Sinobacterium caligoides TaxID=933926 RepID=A0A3N2DP88_9GAMM|nr:ProQ/FINO family protein [Sinobacterium caligoides]ROS01624.1 ProQ/FINO family protein [Sinobacterium caligoides]